MESAAWVVPPHVAGPLVLAPFPALRLAASRVADPRLARTFARPYRAVPERLAAWERRGLLIRDHEPALYLHEYTVGGVTVRGIVGALDVSRRAHGREERAVLPHEAIYPAQADDLADRMERMRLNPAPILLVQHSPLELRVALSRVHGRLPEHQYVDRAGTSHRVWAVRDAPTLAIVASALAPTTCLIADGHHRYAAYLRLHQRVRGAATAAGLAMLVDQDDTPLLLGPIHRVLAGTTVADVLAAAADRGWEVSEARAAEDGSPTPAPGPATHDRVVVTDGRTTASIRPPADPVATVVELLHAEVVPALSHGPSRIGYHHHHDEAVAAARSGIGPALLMPVPSLDRVLATATAGRLLPEKATSFGPKPALGVLLRSLPDG